MSDRMHKDQTSQNSSLDHKKESSASYKSGKIDIDSLRKSYELPHHWELRKEFLKIYQDDFNLDRLICLSNVFVNVECMGLTYPDEVMKLIKELGSKVKGLETYRYQFEKDEPELTRKQAVNRRRS